MITTKKLGHRRRKQWQWAPQDRKKKTCTQLTVIYTHFTHTHAHTLAYTSTRTDQYSWQPTAEVFSRCVLILTCMNSNSPQPYLTFCNHTVALHQEACSHSQLMEHTAGYGSTSARNTKNSSLHLHTSARISSPDRLFPSVDAIQQSLPLYSRRRCENSAVSM